MGALILLLLVMTRKIHHEQHDGDAPPALVAAPIVVFPDRSLEIAALETERDVLNQRVTDLQQQVVELEQSVDEQQAEVDGLRQQLAKLQTTLRAAGSAPDKSDLPNLMIRISDLRSQQVVLRQRLSQHEELLLAKQLRLKALTEDTHDAELKLQKVNSSIVALREQVQLAQHAVTSAGTETVVEFTNTAGTIRTPIIVEVTQDGYKILPAGIIIQKKDMDGFPANDTPLMAAILAVHRERAKNSLTSQPYVLLLVRPLGSEAFYPAQGILVNERIHFGYELIDAGKQIATGESAPSEAVAAETAIAEANRRRDKIYANLRFLAQGNPQQ
ncbi:MAG: hypothetical protein O2856_17245, partial [Planctomycetota bacterium]|nr:hypothetical protein [Planctomycetota bacterium]